jgi:hypothetical protein
MTDRIQHLTVCLDKDYRDDDCECIVNAIRMIKGVRDVKLGDPVNYSDYVARRRVRLEVYKMIKDFIDSHEE